MAGKALSTADTLAARVGEAMVRSSPVLTHWNIELKDIKAGAATRGTHIWTGRLRA